MKNKVLALIFSLFLVSSTFVSSPVYGQTSAEAGSSQQSICCKVSHSVGYFITLPFVCLAKGVCDAGKRVIGLAALPVVILTVPFEMFHDLLAAKHEVVKSVSPVEKPIVK